MDDASRKETSGEMNPNPPVVKEVKPDAPRASAADDASRFENPGMGQSDGIGVQSQGSGIGVLARDHSADASKLENPEMAQVSTADRAKALVDQFHHAAKNNAPVTPPMLTELKALLGVK